MFLKISGLKKLLKTAYKGGTLSIGHIGEMDDHVEAICIGGTWWDIWLRYDLMPKEAKAAIIELCGDIPAPGDEDEKLWKKLAEIDIG